MNQFKSSFKQFLQSEHKQKYFLNLTFDSNNNGDINLSDALVACDDIQMYLSLYHTTGHNVNLIMNQKVIDSNKQWKMLDKQGNVSVKPIQSLLNQGNYVFDDFVELIDRYMNKMPIDQLMNAPQCTGTLKIQKPSLYIFPAGQGDSCYFAINGFTMLINGGFDRLQPCFWKFVNMLEQIDAVLVTHTDSDSLGGLTSLFQKKSLNTEAKPRISVILGNLISSHNSQNLHSSPNKAANLIINELPNCSGNKSDSDLILEAIERLQIKLQPLVIQRPLTEKVKLHYDHFKLYYKAYYGSLDLYLLTPNVQSSDFKDFCIQQQTMISKMHKANLAFQQVYRNLPSSHLASSVCLLVWQPCYQPDSISNSALRLLFTGNCPQNVIFNALDKLKDFDLLAHPVYKIKSDMDQNQQFYNALKKEAKNAKESISSKLHNSMSKSNGEAQKNQTNKSARQPTKPVSAPVTSKKSDTSINKPPVAEKKSTTRQSMNGNGAASAPVSTATAKSSKPVDNKNPLPKQTSVKQTGKPAVPRPVPVKNDSVNKKTTAKPPVSTNNAEIENSEQTDSQSQQSNNSVVKKDNKNGKESTASQRLNTSMSKSNGEAQKNQTNKSARQPTKPVSAPVTSKKSDTSINKPPVAEKKSTTRQSMNGANTGAKQTKTTEGKQSNTSETSSRKSVAKPPPVKKENKNSKTLSLSIEPVQSEQSSNEPNTVENTVEQKGEVVVEHNFINNVVVIETDNIEQIEQVEQVEVVEQVIEQEVVEHEQEVVENETRENESNRMHDQELVEPVEETRADQVVAEINENSSLVIDEQQETIPIEQQQILQQPDLTQLGQTEETVAFEQQEITPLEQQQADLDSVLDEGEVVQQQPVENNQPIEEEQLVQLEHETNVSCNQNQEQIVESDHQLEGEVLLHNEMNPLVDHQNQEQLVQLEHEANGSRDQNQEQQVENVQEEICAVNNSTGEHDTRPRPVELEEPFELVDVDKAYSNESPNLSPVKKDFCEQNGFGDQHTNAPVSEEQLASVENTNLEYDNNADEIVSGNIEKREHGRNDDIMTRSFIEDASDPNSNPFNPVKPLNESCDLNRTHELFQDEESCNTSKTEELVNGTTETIRLNQNSQSNQPACELNQQPEQTSTENRATEQSSSQVENLAPANVEITDNVVKRSVQLGSPSHNNNEARASVKNTSMNSAQKSSRLAPHHPVYVELAYIPAHGNPSYVDAEFFKRIRARHYVLSSIDFGEHILNSLLDGKETWDDKNLQVTLVPTYESDLLRRWFENNQERLARLKVEITHAAKHSIVTVDENPDLNCQAYKLEF